MNTENNMDTQVNTSPDERNNTKTKWKCCLLGTSDPSCLRFSISAILSSFVMIFASSMLAFARLDCPEQNTYIGLITLILGYWLKSPLD